MTIRRDSITQEVTKQLKMWGCNWGSGSHNKLDATRLNSVTEIICFISPQIMIPSSYLFLIFLFSRVCLLLCDSPASFHITCPQAVETWACVRLHGLCAPFVCVCVCLCAVWQYLFWEAFNIGIYREPRPTARLTPLHTHNQTLCKESFFFFFQI